jgi:hypothetical protein
MIGPSATTFMVLQRFAMSPDTDPVGSLANLMGSFWHPVSQSKKAFITLLLVYVYNDMALFVILDLFTWPSQMLFIYHRRQSPRGSTS